MSKQQTYTQEQQSRLDGYSATVESAIQSAIDLSTTGLGNAVHAALLYFDMTGQRGSQPLARLHGELIKCGLSQQADRIADVVLRACAIKLKFDKEALTTNAKCKQTEYAKVDENLRITLYLLLQDEGLDAAFKHVVKIEKDEEGDKAPVTVVNKIDKIKLSIMKKVDELRELEGNVNEEEYRIALATIREAKRELSQVETTFDKAMKGLASMVKAA